LTSSRSHDPSPLFIGLSLLTAAWAIVVAVPAVTLLLVAETATGRWFALGALGVAGLPGLVVALGGAHAAVARRLLLAVTGLSVLAFFFVVRGMPEAPDDGPQRVRATTFARFVPGNWLPEVDQLRLGFTLMPMLDPLLTLSQAKQLRELTTPIYRELESDRDFHRLGSALSDTYFELFGLEAAHDQAFVYVPASVDRRKPTPVLVFFHGSGGNWKAYLWILSQAADRAGFILVAPGNGMGAWRGMDSLNAYAFALATVSREAEVDPRRISVMGLSNGGRAVSQLAAMQGAQFATAIFLSPVFDEPEIASRAFAEQCRKRPMLVITGALDDRVPLASVEKNTAEMSRRGARVRQDTMPDADHFLMFSHRRQLVEVLAEWLGPKS